MSDYSQDKLGKSELYEALNFMMTGYCIWFVGKQLGLFDHVAVFATKHGLLDVVMMSGFIGAGAVVATIRKSLQLRKAVEGRAEAERQTESFARHDALTGLGNRQFFLTRFEEFTKSRPRGDRLAVMVIDLDRFKPVNDVHGHAAGNAVICAVANRLRQIVPSKNIVARLGGDEFALLVTCDEGVDAPIELAERLIAAIREPIQWGQTQIHVDATIGIVPVEACDDDPETLLHAADLAMYQGKREGRGTVRVFAAEMGAAMQARAQLETDLRQGVARGEFEPFYQPIVRLPSEEVVGFEVLARWNHPAKGLVAPDDFVPLAEQTGMIAPLFFSLLRQACTTAQSWPAHLLISVNVAAIQIQDPTLPQRILAILTETGFPPGRLEVEVTETAIINDLRAARSTLMSLQNIGVKIALDDFGTGYSSLYHLRELRFNKLKIDRSYVTTLMQGSEGAKLVDAIIQLGASLGMETTAEGIETFSNVDWLSNRGCTFGQGYLFGRPMPKEAAAHFLQNLTKSKRADQWAQAEAS